MTEISISIPASSQPSGKAAFMMLGTGFDEIEALAPVDVMRRAGMEVFTVSMTENRLVKGATGNLIVADMSVSDLSPDRIDWLIFPGADKSEDAVNLDEKLSELVKAHWEILLSGKKRQNHIFSTNIISYTCFTKKGLSFEAM